MKPCDAKQKYIEHLSKQAHEHYWMQPGLRMAARCAGNPPVRRVLDVGFDLGSSTVWLDLICKAETIVAIDIVTDGAESLREKKRLFGTGKRLFIIRCNVEKLPFKNESFEYVFMRSVLQYTDMEKALAEVISVTGENGTVSIIANCRGNPLVRFYRRFFKPDDKRANMQVGSYIKISEIRSRFKARLKDVGFYNLVSPVLYPVLEKYPENKVAALSFGLICRLEQVVMRVFPVLNRFCWYCYIEVKK